MDLKIAQPDLYKTLSLIQNIVEKKTTMPVLANFLLQAKGDSLIISATDLEVAAALRVSAAVASEGSITVNARVFTDIVRELPNKPVQLSLLERDRILVNCGASKLKVVGTTAAEYPALPGMAVEAIAQIESAQLAEMIAKTFYAISTDETRFSLNGVCLEVLPNGDGLRFVATDGHRLALITKPITGLNLSEQILIPRKGLSDLRKLLGEELGGDIKVGVQEGFFVLQSTDAKIAIRLIDGEFPDYEQVLPSEPGVLATVETSSFAKALRRVALLVTDKGKGVRLDFSEDQLRLSSSSPELGEAQEEIPLQYAGEPVSIGFNARYLLEIAGAHGEEGRLVLELHGPLGAAKLYPEHDESAVAVVMPMRLD